MKKIGLVLFAFSLIVIGLTNNQCRRKPIGPSTLDTTLTTPVIDSTGENINVSVKENSTVSTAPPASDAHVILFNNFEDVQKFSTGQTVDSANIRFGHVEPDGTYIFKNVKPASSTVTHKTFAGHSGGYQYYLYSWEISGSDSLYGWAGNLGAGPLDFTVQINNGNTNGTNQVIAVFKH